MSNHGSGQSSPVGAGSDEDSSEGMGNHMFIPSMHHHNQPPPSYSDPPNDHHPSDQSTNEGAISPSSIPSQPPPYSSEDLPSPEHHVNINTVYIEEDESDFVMEGTGMSTAPSSPPSPLSPVPLTRHCIRVGEDDGGPDDATSRLHHQDEVSSNYQHFWSLKQLGKLCDVTLCLKGIRIPCHKVVLAAAIPYFMCVYRNDMKEAAEPTFTLNIDGMDQDHFESLINYAYTGCITIKSDNVQSLLTGASFLRMERVMDACCSFLEQRLSPHNVLGIRMFGEMHDCSGLVQAAERFTERTFSRVTQSDEFLGLSCQDLESILSRDELRVNEEVEVFEALMRWINHSPTTRESHLFRLLKHVRLPLLSPQVLADSVTIEPLVKKSHQCRDLVDEAKDFHLMPERRSHLRTFKRKIRLCTNIHGTIFAVGGLTRTGDSLSTVETYDGSDDTWKIAEDMSMLRSRVGVAVMNEKLYAIGGYNGQDRLSDVEMLDPKVDKWAKVKPMKFKRSAVGAATLNNRLYVCGGYDGNTSLNTVESYDSITNTWSMVKQMSKSRSAAGVVAFDGCLVALGGHDGLSIFNQVEKYDPIFDVWSDMSPMQTKRCRLGVASLNGKLYVCGGYDGNKFLQTAEVYDPKTERWAFIASMNVTRSRVSLVANRGKLYAIGGYDGVTNLSSVEVYDPSRDEWNFISKMCAHEGGVGVGVIPFYY